MGGDIEEVEWVVWGRWENGGNEGMVEFEVCIGDEKIEWGEDEGCEEKRYEGD